MIANGTLYATTMDVTGDDAQFWAHGTVVKVARIKLDGKEHDILENNESLTPVRERLFTLTETTPHVKWVLLTNNNDSLCPLVPNRWHYRDGFVAPPNLKILHVDSGALLLQKLRDEPGRTAKMAADLLVEIVRQKAREDVSDKTISSPSPADFAKLVGEVAADLVKERALK